jgi:hypothetical protein
LEICHVSINSPGRRPRHSGRVASTARGPGFFARLIASYRQARLRAAEREVARFIDTKGGRMTDSLEREIERNFA